MTLEQLRSCKAIAELRSFSKAAKKVRLTQPSISSQIISLEQELGIKLFDRLRKETVPTKSGIILLKYARMMINLEEEAKVAIDDLLDKRRGEIRLGSSTIPGSYIILPLIQIFSQENPQVKIISKIGDSQSIIGDVLDGTIDLGIIGIRGDNNQLSSYDFIEDRMVLALNPHHPLAERSSITVRELLTLPYIIREEGSGTRRTVEEILRHNGVKPDRLSIVAQLGNTEAIKQAIKLNMGVSILSLCAIYDEIRCGIITYVPINGLTFKRTFFIILHRKKTLLPLINYFKDFLLQNAHLGQS